MLITYTGPDNIMFGAGFFGDNGLHVDLVSVSSTQIVVEQPDTGVITTITGTGLALDANENPVSGTVTGFTFSLNGSVQNHVTDISWGLVAFITALDDMDQNDDYAPLAALFSTSPIVFDGSGAVAGMNTLGLGPLAPFITTSVTTIGTVFDDALVGGAGDDTITPGGNDGYDYLVGTTGNDLYDFQGASGDDFYEMTYGNVAGPITVTLDVSTDTGSVAHAGWTDTLLGVADAATADGFSVAGTGGNDTFNLTSTSDGWLAAGGGAGSDTYNLMLNGGMRLYFNWYGNDQPGANQGLVMDLSTGVVSNDGFGFTDQINILGGSGRLEIRSSYHADSIIGGDRGESFILERGDDTLDAGDGFDRLRYDRSGVDSVSVDLETGMASGMWYGEWFSHTISNVEWVRGSRTGDDWLEGSSASEQLEGMGGNDTLNGRGGQDTLIGGDGNDWIHVGDNNIVRAGEGDDDIDFGAVLYGWAWVGYSDVAGGVTFNVDGVANTGTVTGAGTDTMHDVAYVLEADGLDAEGSNSDDTFNVHLAVNQWMSLQGLGGVDSYNISGMGSVRLNFREGTGASVDLSTGTVNNDGFGNVETITGTVWELRGSNANDHFIGSSNNESFILEGGMDTLDGGLGFDRLRLNRDGYGPVMVDLAAGTATGTYRGNSFSYSLNGIEWVVGTEYDDVITGDSNDNRLDASQGYGAGNDTLHGGDGNDTLNAYSGTNLLNGGTGNDELWSGYGDDTLYGGDGDDRLNVMDGNNLMDGGAGNDTLEGSRGNDTLYAGAGDDLLNSGDGNDINWGGAGNDTFFAGNGNDLLGGGDGNDLMWGGAGNDTFYAGNGDDTLGGGDGNDELWTGLGNNVVYAGNGDDTLGGSSGRDELWGGEGNNIFYAGAGADTLGGGSGSDELWAGDGWDVVYAAGGNDTVAGGEGNDELWAGDGEDVVFGDGGNDTLSGANGHDTIWGGTGDDLIFGVDGDDLMSGGGDNDTIWAGTGNDTLWGDAGDDQLYGVAGNDLLVGHAGNDTLWGGDGADVFVMRQSFGADVVADFDGAEGDALRLDDALWAASGTLTAAQVVSTFGALNGLGNVMLTFDGGESLTLTGVTSLTGLDAYISII